METILLAPGPVMDGPRLTVIDAYVSSFSTTDLTLAVVITTLVVALLFVGFAASLWERRNG